MDYIGETECDAATSLTATTVDPSTVFLSWSAEDGTSYRIDYRLAGGGEITKVPVVANFHTLGGLTPCTAYEYRILVHCPVDGKLFSAWFSFSTPCKEGEMMENMMEIFPNPATESITVGYLTDDAGSVTISVLDITGKKYISEVKEAVSGINSYSLNLGNLESGVYFVQIKNGENQVIDKVIVNK